MFLHEYAGQTIESFLAKIDFCLHGEDCKLCCWPWKASTRWGGYGNFALWIGNPKRHKNVRAHIFMYELKHGIIVDRQKLGIKVRHSCDNPACCNYWHLLLGSQHANMQDMVARGRQRKRITSTERSQRIKTVRYLRKKGFSYQRIAKYIGVHITTVYRILQRYS